MSLAGLLLIDEKNLRDFVYSIESNLRSIQFESKKELDLISYRTIEYILLDIDVSAASEAVVIKKTAKLHITKIKSLLRSLLLPTKDEYKDTYIQIKRSLILLGLIIAKDGYIRESVTSIDTALLVIRIGSNKDRDCIKCRNIEDIKDILEKVDAHIESKADSFEDCIRSNTRNIKDLLRRLPREDKD
jgi:hypothetical protein